MTLEELQERMAYWVEKLRVQDWELHLEWGHPREMQGKNGMTVFIGDYRRQAVILMSTIDYIASRPETHFNPEEDNDMERTLVHELLHVRMRKFEPDDGDEEDEAHSFIHEMSGLLVDLDRKASC